MRPFVELELADGTTARLSPGDIIGRSLSAALPLLDASLSEAHALVSLRGGSLKLLALRGVLAVGGQRLHEVVFAYGQSIRLSASVEVRVVRVQLPEWVYAVELNGEATTLSSAVYSVFGGDAPRLRSGFHSDAALMFFSSGDGWHVRGLDGQTVEANDGDSWNVGRHTLTIRCVPVPEALVAATMVSGSQLGRLHVVAQYDLVHIHRDGLESVNVKGKQAKLLSELILCGGPVAWEEVAKELWRKGNRDTLRGRWDVLLSSLRRRLRDANVRSDLIQSDGKGAYSLMFHPWDVVEDRS